MNFYLMKSIISRAPPSFCLLFCVFISSLVVNFNLYHRTPVLLLLVRDHIDLLTNIRIGAEYVFEQLLK